MQIKSRFVAVALLLLGAWAVIQSARYGLGSVSAPGPGLFPLVLAVILCVLSLVLVVNGGSRTTANTGKGDERLDEESGGLRKFWVVTALLFGYALVLEPLGFVLSSFICMSVLFKVGNPWRWPGAALAAAGAVAIAYLVFVVLMRVPLPRGYWA